MVVAFHAFPGRASGGFVGVDVFFVISGFLITSIIVESLERRAFSFVEFYRRRVQRIFPALLIMLGAVLIVGWQVLLVDEYAELGKHVAAGATFLSNILLYSESGYFDAAAESKPLLHLWSLGIEEQYYIFWPAILSVAFAARLSLLRCTLALALISFAGNCIFIDAHRIAAFYLPFTRFWELLVGSSLACATASTPAVINRFSHRYGTVLSFSGVLLIVASFVTVRSNYAFPGWWALAPTLGTAALIASGPTAAVNAGLLSQRQLVWIGQISFPLYLWHWPLLSFGRLIYGDEPPAVLRVVLVAASFGLAWATCDLVERPLRFGSRSRLKALCLIGAMGSVGGVGLYAYASHGAPTRPLALLTQNFHTSPQQRSMPEPRFRGATLEVAVLTGRRPERVLFAGDSLMGQYVSRIEALYARSDRLPEYSAAFAIMPGCRPVPHGALINSIGKPCDETYRGMIALAGGSAYRTIVVAGNWELVFSDPAVQENLAQMLADFRQLHQRGKTIALIGMNPHSPLMSPKYLARPYRLAFLGRAVDPIASQYLPRDAVSTQPESLRRLALFAESIGATIIDPFTDFCDATQCITMKEGAPVNWDQFHLTDQAARDSATFLDALVGTPPPNSTPQPTVH